MISTSSTVSERWGPGSDFDADERLCSQAQEMTSVVKCTLDDLLVCFPQHASNDEKIGQSPIQDIRDISFSVEKPTLARKKSGSLIRPFQNDKNQQNNSGNGKNVESNEILLQAYQQQPVASLNNSGNCYNQVPLEKIVVQVLFQDVKLSSVVDNDYYTTLLPSKLPPSGLGGKGIFYANLP